MTTGSLDHGFVDAGAEARRAHRDRPRRASAARRPRTCAGCRRGGATPIDPLQLQPGDYVVHEQHGVGRYVEMVQRTVARRRPASTWSSSTRRQARPARRPALRADRPARPGHPLRRRRGARRCTGSAARTGHKRKGRARKAVKRDRRRADPALLARGWPRRATRSARTRPGSASSRTRSRTSRRPTSCARIDEVKADMEKPVPMDRLICGDVGYGKTEIAVRAAFKAVQDGKQVAVLVPTTLLVQQHFATFTERYAQFPVTCRPLSPVPDRQGGQGRSCAGLADGTRRHRHRHPPAAQPDDVRFKDLGLVIVDEEQRFGVEHKEQLKQLRDQRRRAGDVAPRRSRARWRWRSPASARCRRSRPRRRSGTRCSPSSAPTRRSRSPPRSAASCCARARSSTSTTGSSRSTGRGRGCASWCPRRASPSRTAR